MKRNIALISCLLLFSICIWKHPLHTAAQLFAQSTTIQETAHEQNDIPIIVLDAGHGGYDSGCVSEEGYLEKDITLSLVLLTGAILEEQGIHVVYTRSSDEVVWSSDNLDDLRARVNIAEEAEADYYISFHLNSSNYNDGAQGYEIYLDYQNDTIITMASNILDGFDQLGYSINRGLKNTEDSSLYVIDHNDVPAMLIEFGFFNDREDSTYLTSSIGQEAIANALANSILSSL